MATLTTANSVLMLGVANLFNVPVQIQGYATDDAFTVADAESAETYMGVDGKLSAGFTPYIQSLEITLQADSASVSFFDAIITAERIAKEKYVLNGTILVQGTNTLYTMTRGFLKGINIAPAAKKTLQPRKFTIDFEEIIPAPV